MTEPRDLHDMEAAHQGTATASQIATGTPTTGYVPVSTGDPDVPAAWGAMSGGGGGSTGECDHRHVSEEFSAGGGSPEGFTVAYTPLWGARVYLEGARVPPSGVTVTDTLVELDTTGGDAIVIDYEAECATSLLYPGTSMSLGGDDQNVLATIVTTGPAAVRLTLTEAQNSGGSFSDRFAAMDATDDFLGTWAGAYAVDNAAPGTYYFPIFGAGTWYIVGTYDGGSYVGDLTGAGSFTVIEPTGTPTGTLSFPGVSDGTVQNELESTSTAGPSAIFMTLDSDLPDDYSFGVYGDVSGDHYYSATGVPFPAGTYVFVTNDADATLQLYAYLAGTYDGGLTGSGDYEIIAL